MPAKRYIAANDLLIDSFALAVQVHQSGFRPDFLVGVWRGGSAVGIAVQEGLERLGVSTDHIALRTSYADPDNHQPGPAGEGAVRVHGQRYLLERVEEKHTLLIVDDVLSTGRSVEAIIAKLRKRARCNTPHDIRVATVWFRPSERSVRRPNYFLRETTDWLVLPHELDGLTPEEIAEHKPAAAALKSLERAGAD